MKRRCHDCHGADQDNAALRFDTLSSEIGDESIAQRWQDILDVLNLDQMPPEEAEHPNSAWVEKQADLFADQTTGRDEKPSIVMHDKDSKFTKGFTAKLKSRSMRTNSLPKASPNLNGRCERFIETIKLECLAKFVIFGKQHLDYLVMEFANYYNTRRSHMEREYLPPVREEPQEVDTLKLDQIEVKSYVGGLVKSFERIAA